MKLSEFEKKDDARIIRTKYSGDKVYLLQGDKKYWIKNPDTLFALGFNFGQEEIIEMEEYYKFKDGGSLDVNEKEKTETSDSTQEGEVLDYRKSA